MSNRNPKRPAPKAASKAGRQRKESLSSTTTFEYASVNSFSEDNYSAVDDIEDDDEDEMDITAVEERAIMGEPSPASTFRPVNNDNDDANDGDDESDELSSISSEEVSWCGFSPEKHENEAESPDLEDVMDHAVDQDRHVQFDAPPSEGTDTDTDIDGEADEMYPDLFIAKAALDPFFRASIEGPMDSSSDAESTWDFDTDNIVDTTARHNPLADFVIDSAPRASATMSDLIREQLGMPESDGETTEDEDYPDGPIKPPTTEPHEQDDHSDSECEAPVRHSKDQPLTTAFSLSKRRRKPIAVYNTKTKKMIFFTQGDLEQRVQHLHGDPFTGSLAEPSSPLKNDVSLSQGTQALFNPVSATFGGDSLESADLVGSDLLSPLEFAELLNRNPFARELGEFEDIADFSAAEPNSEDDLDIGAFLDFDDDTSDEDTPMEPSSTPVRPTTATPELSHLHSSNVGAFRQNQVNARLIRNGATQDSIDFSGPYQSTVIKGIRSDRFDTAIAPLTPARRHKRHNSDAARSPLDAASTKRKASAEPPSENGHKKQKSISTGLTDMHM